MIKKSSGSALILVLGITSTVMILSLVAWHKMSLVVDLVTERERFYNNFYRTEAILQVGLLMARENFDALMHPNFKRKMPITFSITTPSDFFGRGITACCVVDWQNLLEKDALVVRALMYDNQNLISELSCVLIKKQMEQAKNTKKNYFVIKNFTIGSVT